MESLAKSDLFFVLTGIAVILVTVLLVWLLIYLLRIARVFFRISKEVEGEASEFKKLISRGRRVISHKLFPGKK